MRILVVGIGDLGSDFARRAVADGHEVLGLRRSERVLPDGVEPLRGDVADPSTFELPAGLDAVVYAVAADGRTDEAYERAYPRGLSNVLQALGDGAPDETRVVFVSSTGVWGNTDGAEVDEDSRVAPSSFTGTRLFEAEQALARSRFRGTSLRLGGIYGPGRTFLVDSVRSGRATYTPGIDAWTNRIHRDDAARAILHVLSLDEPASVYNVVDRRPTRRREVLEWLAERLGAPLPVAEGPVAEGPVTAEGSGTRRAGITDKRVSSARLVASGFEHEHPDYRHGYAALLDD